MIERPLRKKIEQAFYEYRKNRAVLNCETLNMIARSNLITDYDKLPVDCWHGESRESKIIKNLDETDEQYKWCLVVEYTLNKFYGDGEGDLIKLRFFKNKSVNETASLLNVDRATYFRWKDKIMEAALYWAKNLRIIK